MFYGKGSHRKAAGRDARRLASKEEREFRDSSFSPSWGGQGDIGHFVANRPRPPPGRP